MVVGSSVCGRAAVPGVAAVAAVATCDDIWRIPAVPTVGNVRTDHLLTVSRATAIVEIGRLATAPKRPEDVVTCPEYGPAASRDLLQLLRRLHYGGGGRRTDVEDVPVQEGDEALVGEKAESEDQQMSGRAQGSHGSRFAV